MNSSSLSTASSYLNNLLLSRGLLRDGQPVDFAHPSHGAGGKGTTLARIITLVHDLILRRDKESDTLSALSTALTRARSDSVQKDDAIARLAAKQSELERALALAKGTEERLRETVRKSQGQIKGLREESIRLKNTVSQVRAQCVGDVRKREADIRRLQRHLEGKRGGGKEVGVTVVQPGGCLRGLGGVVCGGGSVGESRNGSGGLRAEANAYLAGLSRELESENVEMKNLLQGTVRTLRHLQGLPDSNNAQQDLSTIREEADADATNLTTATSFDAHISIAAQPESFDHLASSLHTTLSSLQQLLTSPSFVPLEEVELRDDEIARLRAGWDKMEVRWREALGLMNEWRKRMVEKGDTLNLEDLSKGLVLGEGKIEIPPPGSVVRGKRKSMADESFVSDASGVDGIREEEGDMPTPTATGQARLAAPAKAAEKHREPPKLGFGLLPAPQVLKATSGNLLRDTSLPAKSRATMVKANSPRARALVDALGSDNADELALLDAAPSPTKRRRVSQEKDADENQDENEEEDAFLDLLPTPAVQPSNAILYPTLAHSENQQPRFPSRKAEDILQQEEEEDQNQDLDSDSDLDSPPLTIEQKLALAQHEAEAAKFALRAAIADSPPADQDDSSSNSRNNNNITNGKSHVDSAAEAGQRTPRAPQYMQGLSSPSPRKADTNFAAGTEKCAAASSVGRMDSTKKRNKQTPSARVGAGVTRREESERGIEDNRREEADEKENADPAARAMAEEEEGMGDELGKGGEEEREEKGKVAAKKRTRAPVEARMELKMKMKEKGMRRSKRRSTLSPAELEGLVGL